MSVKQYLKTRTGRLALTYLAIIMAMTVAFSIIIYAIAAHQVSRPLEPRNFDPNAAMIFNGNGVQAMLDQRAREARTELLLSLGALNMAMLVFGVWFSMFLAERTMRPIEQAMQEQAQFVSDASHELRTPLTALQSMNEVALRRKKISDADARELATKNVSETAKLYALTTSLLGLVRADQSAEQKVPVDLQQLVGDAMQHIVTQAQKKAMTVDDTVANAIVVTEPSRVEQVLTILLDNAVKYSNNRGTIRVFTEQKNDQLITLHVADAGSGINEHDLPKIFNRFYRVDESRSKRRHDGYGIGLAIAKTISDQLKLNIAVTSKVGEGSDFSIDLPLKKEK